MKETEEKDQYMKNLCEYYLQLAKQILEKNGKIETEYYIHIDDDLCLRYRSRFKKNSDNSNRFGGYGYIIDGKEIKK